MKVQICKRERCHLKEWFQLPVYAPHNEGSGQNGHTSCSLHCKSCGANQIAECGHMTAVECNYP